MVQFDSITAVTPFEITIGGCPCCKRVHRDDLRVFQSSRENVRLFYCEMEGKPYVLIREDYTGPINFTLNGIRPQRRSEPALASA